MRQKESRNRLFVMLFLLISMLMVFTFTNAETADELTLGDFFLRLISLTDSKVEASFPKLNHITGETKNYTATTTFKLPASLKAIQDEAFEGTALVTADLSGTSVEKIGERAFANIPTLIGIRVPEKTRFIAKTAFAGSDHVTLTGAPRGYTHTWAMENGIPFAPIATFTANTHIVQFGIISHRSSETLQTGLTTDYEGIDGNNPTRQTVGEIKDNRCQEGIAYHIQGRAPPVHVSSITNRT